MYRGEWRETVRRGRTREGKSEGRKEVKRERSRNVRLSKKKKEKGKYCVKYEID